MHLIIFADFALILTTRFNVGVFRIASRKTKPVQTLYGQFYVCPRVRRHFLTGQPTPRGGGTTQWGVPPAQVPGKEHNADNSKWQHIAVDGSGGS